MFSRTTFSPRFLRGLAQAVVVVALPLAVTSGARAAGTVTTYNNLTAFQAAAPSTTPFAFEGIAPNGGSTANPALSPLSFTISGGVDTTVFAVDSAAGGGTYSLNNTDSIAAGSSINGSLATTRIDFGGTAFTAFSTEIGQVGSNTSNYTFRFFSGNTQVGADYTTGTANRLFVGATTNSPFDNVRVTSNVGGQGYMIFDNVRNGSASVAVPEPGSLALVGASLLPLVGGVAMRRRRRRAA